MRFDCFYKRRKPGGSMKLAHDDNCESLIHCATKENYFYNNKQKKMMTNIVKRKKMKRKRDCCSVVIFLVSCLLPVLLLLLNQPESISAILNSEHQVNKNLTTALLMQPAQQEHLSTTIQADPLLVIPTSRKPRAANEASPSASLQIPQTTTATTIASGADTSEASQLPTNNNNTIASSSSTIKTSSKQSNPVRRASDLRQLTETELLPFADFNVQQPAFSDLIKIWPPTTQHQLRQYQSSKPVLAVSKQQHTKGGHSKKDQKQASSANNQPWWFLGAPADSLDPYLQRNNLNEDLDDTIVTADQSFESEQAAEPMPYVNYLGELGDFIYAQAKRLFDRSHTNSSSPSPSMAPSVANNLRAILEELVDDHYYAQYENSQVLYYGPQLAREGDIVEIGCFMPNDQASEWTKSALPIVQQQQQQQSSSAASSDLSLVQAQQQQQNNNNNQPGVIELGQSGALLPRLIKRTDFLGAKLNFSLKIFEAQVSDSGNYRCNRMSRKYHKLLVVPQRISHFQLYHIQQRLLSIVNPKLVGGGATDDSASELAYQVNYVQPPHVMSAVRAAAPPPPPTSQPASQKTNGQRTSSKSKQQQQQNQQQQQQATSLFRDRRNTFELLPNVLIIEQEPLLITCNISDEFVLRKLRDNDHFQLSWYKNGKLLRQSLQQQQQMMQQQQQRIITNNTNKQRPSNNNNNPIRQQQQHVEAHVQKSMQQQLATSTNSSERIQILGANGRQLLITSAQFNDAGDYLCSWSKLLSGQFNNRQRQQSGGGMIVASGGGDTEQASSGDEQAATTAPSPLSAGHMIQLSAPTRLRPFARSVFHVREASELRLACMAQGGYPAPIISWYLGNRLVDEDFLRQAQGDVRILQVSSASVSQLVALGEPQANRSSSSSGSEQQDNSKLGSSQIVEINPIPGLSTNQGAGSGGSNNNHHHRKQQRFNGNSNQQPASLNWIDFRDKNDERLALESPDQQLRYLQFKLAQLMSLAGAPSLATPLLPGNPAIGEQLAAALQASNSNQQSQQQPASLVSVLVISALDLERHSARVACRATTRVNTDEVTTVIKVLTSSTITVQPSSGRANLIYGQSLNLECGLVGQDKGEFKWFKTPLYSDQEEPIMPDNDEVYQIHNERLKLIKPAYEMAGDYRCKPIVNPENGKPESAADKDGAVIKVRAQPYIEEFGIQMSHTGRSAILTDGEPLELICKVDKLFGPVNISWYRSQSADDDSLMVPLLSTESSNNKQQQLQDLSQASATNILGPSTFHVQNDHLVMIEKLDTHSKKLTIKSVKQDHRGYYACLVDNGVTEKAKKVVYLRVKDKLAALWPFLGIIAEIFILLTIIQIWETKRAYKEVSSSTGAKTPTTTPHKRQGGVVVPASPETVPLTSA